MGIKRSNTKIKEDKKKILEFNERVMESIGTRTRKFNEIAQGLSSVEYQSDYLIEMEKLVDEIEDVFYQ